MPDYDRSIHSNPDARAWAKFFVERMPHFVGPIDEALMIGWFANAMEAMRTHLATEGLAKEKLA